MILLWQNDQESRLLLLVLQMKKVKENQMLQVQVAMNKIWCEKLHLQFQPAMVGGILLACFRRRGHVLQILLLCWRGNGWEISICYGKT